MAFLELNDLYKTFPTENSKAVTGVNFQLNESEILGILGESGCGKSTLLRLIAGLEQPDSGNIVIENTEVIGPKHKLLAGHKDITLVHQHYELFPNHSVFENVFEALKTYEEDLVKNQQVNEMLEICRLSEFETKFPRELSGGQRQRVALARALINKPKLLLLDEPFSDLDTILKSALKKDIYQIIKETGTTAILVTHDAKDALPICDSIAIMKDGNILERNDPKNIYENPSSIYAASFCGNMSIFPFSLIEPNNSKIAGIRPEHVNINLKTNGIKCTVRSIMYMGNHYEITATTDNTNWILTTNEDKYQTGDVLYLSFDKKNCVIFS